MTRMVRQRMDLRSDGSEHEHGAVASHDGPEVVSGSVAVARRAGALGTRIFASIHELLRA
jgi:hypothetical protein